MFFILQKENNCNVLNIEYQIIKELLDKNKYANTYIETTLDDLKNGAVQKWVGNMFYNAIPVGTIDFVSIWLNKVHKKTLNPIEIPPCLRTDEFLKRQYKIVNASQLPQKGKYFIKDVSVLKSFNSNGYTDLSQLHLDDILYSSQEIEEKIKNNNDEFAIFLNKDHIYQVSELVEVLSEYRVYFINGEIENISNYNGDCRLFPDIKLIEKANLIYSIQKDYPISYTMDVMVNNRGTSIIEIHPFTSIGLYSSLWGNNLLDAYRDGIDYYIKHNTPLKVT